jgi:hypothetical protein
MRQMVGGLLLVSGLAAFLGLPAFANFAGMIHCPYASIMDPFYILGHHPMFGGAWIGATVSLAVAGAILSFG